MLFQAVAGAKSAVVRVASIRTTSAPLSHAPPHLIMHPIRDVFLMRLPGICCCSRDLSEQIKKVTKDVHVRAESTELMLSFQRGQVTLQQYKVPE